MAKIDNDGITDTIRYDKHCGYIAILSSINNNPVEVTSINLYEDQTQLIYANEGFVTIRTSGLRYELSETYIFEKATKRFRLARYNTSEYGNLGRGNDMIDYIDNKFIGNWSYADSELCEIVEMPQVEMPIESKYVYMGEVDTTSYDYDELQREVMITTLIQERTKRFFSAELLENKMTEVAPEDLDDSAMYIATYDLQYYTLDKQYHIVKPTQENEYFGSKVLKFKPIKKYSQF